ncbi:MAG: hypothetical protein HYY26_04565 [Acidobacteria bacterium]|nr:hypothetical protein [Acidobacteriota bacterium]
MQRHEVKRRRRWRWVTAASLALAVAAVVAGTGEEPARAAARAEEAGARAAFGAAYAVFMHPRCLNCHPAGEQPLQGDDSRPHAQNVQRGRTGNGKYALKCSNCHQTANVAGRHMPPGAPNWHLPPPGMPMVFEGKTAGELCRQFKDPAENGGKTIAGVIHHIEEDPLVLWGWSPGEGRTPPPLSRAEFVAKMKQWADGGAPCPE